MSEPQRSDLVLRAWDALKGANWAVFRRLQEEMPRVAGATPAQMGFLHLLARKEAPMTPVELAKECDVTPATVTGMLNALEESGLVARARESKDRRVVHVRLTPAGKRLLERWREAFRKNLDEVMAPLSEDDLQTLATILARVAPPIHGPPGGFANLIRKDLSSAPKPTRKATPARKSLRRK